MRSNRSAPATRWLVPGTSATAWASAVLVAACGGGEAVVSFGGSERAAPAAHEHQGQREVVVRMAVAHIAALEDDRTVEHGAIAVAQLSEPLDVRPIPLTTRRLANIMAAAKSGEMSIAGYATDYGEQLMLDKGCELLGEATDVKLLVHRCDVTFGVSGAPLLLIEGGKAEIIGIHNAVAETDKGPIATAVPVSAFAHSVSAALSLR